MCVETIHMWVETMDMRVEVLRKLCRVYTPCAVSIHDVKRALVYMLCNVPFLVNHCQVR